MVPTRVRGALQCRSIGWRVAWSLGSLLLGSLYRVAEAKWEPYGLNFPQHCNLPVQGICADAMLRAINMVFRRLRGLRAGLVASVHDELLVEADERDAETAQAILEEAMVDAFEVCANGNWPSGVTSRRSGAATSSRLRSRDGSRTVSTSTQASTAVPRG
jgi:hypothetical protein